MTAAMPTLLDQIVQRLQNLPSWNIWQILADGTIAPWYEVDGAVVRDLVIHQANVTDQGAAVSAQITHWGRLTAQAARIVEIEERRYRVWRDKKCLEFLTPDPSDKDWKKPTEKQLEMLYRTHPEYETINMKLERAKEAHLSTEAVLLGFQAKKDMLRSNPGRGSF